MTSFELLLEEFPLNFILISTGIFSVIAYTDCIFYTIQSIYNHEIDYTRIHYTLYQLIVVWILWDLIDIFFFKKYFIYAIY